MGRGRGRLRQGALAALTGAVAVTALALFAFVVRDLPAYDIGPRIPWWALALAFAVTELFVVHAHVRGSAHSLSMSELPLILGLLLATPQDLVIAHVVGPAVVLLLTRGHSPMKLVFNLAQFALTACLAVITLHALAALPGTLGPRMWFATFAAVGASALTGATLVFAAIALSEGVIPSRRLALLMSADLLVALTNTSVGLAGATLVAQDQRAGWLLLAPACVLLLAYRAYLSERTKHESLEFLYGVARSLSRAPDIETRARRHAAPHPLRVPRRGGRDRPLLRWRHAAADLVDGGRRGEHGADRARARGGAARLRGRRAGHRRRLRARHRAARPLPGDARDLPGARRAGAG